MSESVGRVVAHVLFLKPSDMEEGWERTDLWRRAASIPGVAVGGPHASGRARHALRHRRGADVVSALLIHLTGGRIETHFHVFGSLAFLAFYRDWRVLVPATLTVSAEHLLRGLFWPESVYGVANPEWWRFLEHACWVVFEDVVLVMSCLVGVREMKDGARKRAEVEALLKELRDYQEQLVRTEKLAAVGQLAASVGHELRNPLSAVQNAATYIKKRMGVGADAKVVQFFGIIDRELLSCAKTISDLLDFAREQPLALGPCPLYLLVDEAIQLVPPGGARIVNEVPEELTVPALDREVFRKALINLIQNAAESIPADRDGRSRRAGERRWPAAVADHRRGQRRRHPRRGAVQGVRAVVHDKGEGNRVGTGHRGHRGQRRQAPSRHDRRRKPRRRRHPVFDRAARGGGVRPCA